MKRLESVTQIKYIRMSPPKIRRLLVQLKGKSTEEAITILKFLPYKCSKIINKILYLAVNNAKNSPLNNSPTKIIEARVDSGPILKRFCPHAQGRGFPIKKQTSHITITI
jgi:large subunit ribosomal protein L22